MWYNENSTTVSTQSVKWLATAGCLGFDPW